LWEETVREGGHPWAEEVSAIMGTFDRSYREVKPATIEDSSRVAVIQDTEAGLLVTLTRRELDVLQQLALGGSYADISRALFVTENTVKTHVASIYRKLGAERRAEALSTARAQGLL
jgi:DNA-binding NarL/FixJ family response regulator